MNSTVFELIEDYLGAEVLDVFDEFSEVTFQVTDVLDERVKFYLYDDKTNTLKIYI